MRKALILIVLLAAPSYAQEASNNTPTTRASEAKHVMKSLEISQNVAKLVVTVRDASNNDIRDVEHLVPDATHPTATIPLLLTALDTAVAGETGSAVRRANLRLLDYLSDHGYLTGVTLVP